MANGFATARPDGSVLWNVIYRFPIPLFCALFLALLNGQLIRTAATAPGPFTEAAHNLSPFFIAVFFYSFAISLYGEATRRRCTSIVALVAGIAALFFSYSAYRGFAWLFWPSHAALKKAPAVVGPRLFPDVTVGLWLVIAALVILPFIAPYLRMRVHPSAFWQFAHKLAVACLAATLGAALIFGGIAAIAATSTLLFNVDVPPLFYSQAANIAFTLGAPVIWFALAPTDFDELPRSGREKEFTSRTVSLLVRFILIPLALILSLMLAAYAVLVLGSGKFDTARLGLRGLIYGAGIVGTALLAYPDAEDSRIARIFMWLWPWLLIPPIALLFPSIWIRISEYGWTPYRYLVFAAGVWMALIALIGIRWRFELRVIPALLALSLILSAVGPWGVSPVTGESQTKRLEAFLTAEGKLANGKWLDTGKSNWSYKDQKLLISAVSALEETGQLKRLEPWFSEAPDNPFANLSSVRENLNRKLNISFYQPARIFNTPSPRVFKISSEAYLYGPIHKYREDRGESSVNSPLGMLNVTLKGTTIEVQAPAGRKVTFDMAPLLTEAKEIGDIAGTNLTEPTMRVLSGEGSLKAQLVVAHLFQNVNSGVVSAEFFLILPASPGG